MSCCQDEYFTVICKSAQYFECYNDLKVNESRIIQKQILQSVQHHVFIVRHITMDPQLQTAWQSDMTLNTGNKMVLTAWFLHEYALAT